MSHAAIRGSELIKVLLKMELPKNTLTKLLFGIAIYANSYMLAQFCGFTHATYPEAIRARDWAIAIRCSAGRLSPARLDLGGRGAAQVEAPDEATGPRTRAEGEGVQVEEAVEISGRPGAGAVEVAEQVDREEEAEGWGAEACAVAAVVVGGGGGGGSGGGGGRVEEMDRAAVAELRKERELLKPPPNPRVALATPPPPTIPPGSTAPTPKPPVAPTTDVL